MSTGDRDHGRTITSEPHTSVRQGARDPRPAAVTFVTTEHFTLQGERSRAISELTARASIFLATVSGALIALGLMATATHVGTAFYAFALILLPTLSFVGFVTFERTLQTSSEDHSCAHRIARLRSSVTAVGVSRAPRQRRAGRGLRSRENW